jgi:hypothetical protein
MRVGEKVRDVVLGSGEEIIDAQDVAAYVEEALAKMRAYETRAARDKNAAACGIVSGGQGKGIDAAWKERAF